MKYKHVVDQLQTEKVKTNVKVDINLSMYVCMLAWSIEMSLLKVLLLLHKRAVQLGVTHEWIRESLRSKETMDDFFYNKQQRRWHIYSLWFDPSIYGTSTQTTQ